MTGRWMVGATDLNQRPLAPQANPERVARVAAGGSASQPHDFVDCRGGPESHGVAPNGPGGTDFGAPAVRDFQSGSLLTVAEVARRLGVCRATAYRICRAGQLGHVRVSNAIRVPENALVAYLFGRASR
jgi:excisionase family DNA binding protein